MIYTNRAFADSARSGLVLRAKQHGIVADPGSVGTFGRMFSKSIITEDGGVNIEGFASTETVDSDREVLLADGLNFDTLRRLKTIYCDHEYGVRSSVGTLRHITREKHWSGGGWRIKVRMLPAEVCDIAPIIEALARQGAMGFSVGYVAHDHGPPTAEESKRYAKARSIVRKAEVFEVSFTSMPCNMACAADSVSVDESKASEVAELAVKHQWHWRPRVGIVPQRITLV